MIPHRVIPLLFCLLFLGTQGDSDVDWDPEKPVENPRDPRTLVKDVNKGLSDLQKYLRAQSESTGRSADLQGKNIMNMVEKIQGLLDSDAPVKEISNKPAEETSGKQNNRSPLGRKPSRRPHTHRPSYHEYGGYGPSAYEDGVNHRPTHSHEESDDVEEEDSQLDLHEFKQLWLDMLYDTYKILNDRTLIDYSGESVKTLETIFELLNDIDLIDVRTDDTNSDCPYGFNRVGTLCLAAEFLNEALTWEDARLYCQIVKGGDLAVFKDLCEFHEAVVFLNSLTHGAPEPFSYWVGATDLANEGSWKWVDGTQVPLVAGLWGTRKGSLEPTGEGDQNHGILLNKDFFYLHDIDNALAVEHMHPLPLCQYIPQRDGKLEHQKKPTGFGPLSAFDDINETPGYGSSEERPYGQHHPRPSGHHLPRPSSHYGHNHYDSHGGPVAAYKPAHYGASYDSGHRYGGSGDSGYGPHKRTDVKKEPSEGRTAEEEKPKTE